MSYVLRGVGCAIATVLLVPVVASAQTTYPCLRVDTGMDEGCGANSFGSATANGVNTTFNDGPDSGETGANSAAAASQTNGGAMANASGMGTSGCATARNAQASVPQVSSAVTSTAQASVTATGGSANGQGGANAGAITQWEVLACSDPNADNPVLAGSMYLVSTGANTGAGYLFLGGLSATCGGSSVTATVFAGEFWISGTLMTSGGAVNIWDLRMGGMNQLYPSEEQTSVGNVHPLNASCGMTSNADAPPNSTARWDASSTAWFEVEER